MRRPEVDDIPVLFFGLELIILGGLLAAGVMARTLLGQPWVVEAVSGDPLGSGRLLEWRVRGWRRSQTLIAEVAAEVVAGNDLSTVRPVTKRPLETRARSH